MGNGTSVLDYEYGQLIDSFDIVVRFNDFRIDGFEDHVGERTDCWFTCENTYLEDVDKFDRVILHTWEYERTGYLRSFTAAAGAKFEMTSKSDVAKIPVKWPSTGLIAVHQFIREFGRISIVGFDWWERAEHHYGDNIHIRGDLHEPLEEYKIIDSLRLEKKIDNLSK